MNQRRRQFARMSAGIAPPTNSYPVYPHVSIMQSCTAPAPAEQFLPSHAARVTGTAFVPPSGGRVARMSTGSAAQTRATPSTLVPPSKVSASSTSDRPFVVDCSANQSTRSTHPTVSAPTSSAGCLAAPGLTTAAGNSSEDSSSLIQRSITIYCVHCGLLTMDCDCE